MIPDSKHLIVTLEFKQKNAVVLKRKTTGRYNSMKEVMEAIQQIRNDQVSLDHQIWTLKIWRVGRNTIPRITVTKEPLFG